MSSGSEKLVAAAGRGDLAAVSLLLERGQNVNVCEPGSGVTPLIAAVKGGHTAMVKLLLESGASASARINDKGRQALHYAADRGSVEIAELLVAAGANVNASVGGLSPLMISALTPHSEMVEFLIEAGAMVQMKGSDGTVRIVSAAQCHRKPSCLVWQT